MTDHHHHIEGVSAYVVGCEADGPCPSKGLLIMGVSGWNEILDPCTDPDCDFMEDE